ncbi:archaeosortase A [Halobacteriales archaeon QS_8_65_32]|jgi:archaeosortase A (PGF-CTERM-specific)|nr:MAG: archaeosortase A [Halobacteriales archaeon QS_8_65_32]
MIAGVLDALAGLGTYSDALAWVVIAAFCTGVALERLGRTERVGGGIDRRAARYVTAGAWVTFGFFWLSLVHYYGIEGKSIVEGVLSLLALPASIYVGVLLARGRDSLFVLSRAVAAMGLIFLPFELIVPLQETLIEVVTRQTETLLTLVGYPSGGVYDVVSSAEYGKAPYRNTFVFTAASDHTLTYTIRIACTGIGSIAIVAGLIAAVRAPLSRKAEALAVSIPVIYGLNLVRNVFIAVAFGTQRLHVFPEFVASVFATDDPYLISYLVADRILSQSLSIVALVGITWFVVRRLPEVLTIVEDVLYVVTRNEYDLRSAFDVETPDRTDRAGKAD